MYRAAGPAGAAPAAAPAPLRDAPRGAGAPPPPAPRVPWSRHSFLPWSRDPTLAWWRDRLTSNQKKHAHTHPQALRHSLLHALGALALPGGWRAPATGGALLAEDVPAPLAAFALQYERVLTGGCRRVPVPRRAAPLAFGIVRGWHLGRIDAQWGRGASRNWRRRGALHSPQFAS